MKMIFATSNRGKLQEASEILGEAFTLVSPADMGIFDDIEETGSTLKENAIIKASFIHEKTGLDCFADDTGLEVDALGGAPGVYTARFAGPDCNWEANIDKLLRELEGVPMERRTARFRCTVALILGGELHCFDGLMEGRIAFQRAGARGFGYDPVFIPMEGGGLTASEMGVEGKNAISHRGKSLRAMAEFLKNR